MRSSTENLNASARKKRALAVSTRKLAPLDHSRTLYAGAASLQKEAGARSQFRIEELQMAVRQMAPLNNPARKLEEQILKQSDAFVESGTEGRLNTVEAELGTLKDSLNESARRYNALRTQAKQKQQRLQTLVDRLEQLRFETQGIRELEKHETPEARRLQELKHEIEQVDAHVAQKLRYKHQLHHVLERSRESYTRYDANIKAMADALRVADRELLRVGELMRQLDNARDKAVKDTQRVREQVAADDVARKAKLEQRRQEAFTAQRMEEWRAQREHMRLELAAELRGDLSKEEEEKLKRRYAEEERATLYLDQKQKEKAAEAERHERVHHKIRKATGVASLSEMHKKYESQDRARQELEDSRAVVEAQLAQARARKRALAAELAELKASGVGGAELSRETREKLEEKIARSKVSLKVNQATCERLDSVMVAVQQGALGLHQRLRAFPGLLTSRDEARIERTVRTVSRDHRVPPQWAEVAFSRGEVVDEAHGRTALTPSLSQGVETLDLLRYSEAALGKMRRLLDARRHDARRRQEMARARGGGGGGGGGARASSPGEAEDGDRPESPLSVLTSRSGAMPLATPAVPGTVKPASANIRVLTRRAATQAEKERARRASLVVSRQDSSGGEDGAEESEDEAGRRRIKLAAQRAQAAEVEREQKARRRAKQAEKEALSGAPARQSAKAFLAHQQEYMEKLAGTSRGEVPVGPLSPAKAPKLPEDEDPASGGASFFLTQS